MLAKDKLTVLGQHDDKTLAQMLNCLQDDRAIRGVLCADGHLGYAQPVGGVIEYQDHISVSGVGVDIACGNYAVKLDLKTSDLAHEDLIEVGKLIAKNISFGLGRSNTYAKTEHPLFEKGAHPAWDIPFLNELKRMAENQLGTVGGGNHYVDVFTDDNNNIWVGNHFGSRGLGHKIAMYYTEQATGKKNMGEEPIILSVHSDLGREYLMAMSLAGAYAYAGREWVNHTIVKDFFGAKIVDAVHNHHNYAWMENDNWVVRKGATPLFPGQRGFVGGSMGDMSVILKGKAEAMEPAMLNSTIHGSGRLMSRTAATGKSKWGKVKGPGLVDEAAWRSKLTGEGLILHGAGGDEMPQVYRPLQNVLDAHAGTFEIETVLRPLIVVMAGADEQDPYKD